MSDIGLSFEEANLMRQGSVINFYPFSKYSIMLKGPY